MTLNLNVKQTRHCSNVVKLFQLYICNDKNGHKANMKLKHEEDKRKNFATLARN